MTSIPFISAQVPSLSSRVDDILKIENSGIFTNYGPVNTRFETELRHRLFNGAGACMTVCNATIGLMLAIRQAARQRPADFSGPRYALMPAFTFAAAAQAALWCGLTPLFCDIDPRNWSACPASERRLIAEYGDAIDVIVPYATFGNCIDLAHYDALHDATGAGIVVDAAASLGALDEHGLGFGTGFRHTIVYSMHATKTFGIGEGGVIYSADPDKIDALRLMGNFGFGAPRTATMPGLNAKLSEFAALLALHRLDDIVEISMRRSQLAELYRARLHPLEMQRVQGLRPSYQFYSFLVPEHARLDRDTFRTELKARDVETGAYFSPHLMQQPYLAQVSIADDLPVTKSVSSRIVSLPLWNGMTDAMAHEICDAVLDLCAQIRPAMPQLPIPAWAPADASGNLPFIAPARPRPATRPAQREVA